MSPRGVVGAAETSAGALHAFWIPFGGAITGIVV